MKGLNDPTRVACSSVGKAPESEIDSWCSTFHGGFSISSLLKRNLSYYLTKPVEAKISLIPKVREMPIPREEKI